ncbi:hypothetical protein PsYK624_033580 [Phanerochaete sordida]|uniref:Uncharacterized protein n=1 Tax=Phanerochaete sordida TaxID=48140 RepID=A0A9P3G3M4_9APHY|nr:hypothetical protein PsYK624_033580 [Phanerochaete sordida]
MSMPTNSAQSVPLFDPSDYAYVQKRNRPAVRIVQSSAKKKVTVEQQVVPSSEDVATLASGVQPDICADHPPHSKGTESHENSNDCDTREQGRRDEQPSCGHTNTRRNSD